MIGAIDESHDDRPMNTRARPKIAILDDYQNVALSMADWSAVAARADMKPTARLINTSRGPIIDEQALIETLRTRSIAGAALDVFDIEPLPADHPFRRLDKVLSTPHVGFVTQTLYQTFYGDAVRAIASWLIEQRDEDAGSGGSPHASRRRIPSLTEQ